MLTVKDFLSQYENLSDRELYQSYLNINDYSDEAKEAIDLAIKKRGGLESITNNLKKQQTKIEEINRIQQETQKLFVPGNNSEFLKTIITSEILSPTETHEIIQTKLDELQAANEDKKIKPRTILGSLAGGAIASVIGGVLWGLQMIQMHRIFYIFVIGLVILSYGLIKLFTKQSRANAVVLIATVISVVAALFIGQMIYRAFG